MKAKVLFLAISVILLLAVAVQTVTALMYNHSLTKNYVHKPETYDYKGAIIGGSINVNEVEKLFPSIETLPGYNLTNVISSPVTIRYYYAIGDRSPAYVIDKGTRIHVRRDGNSSSVKVGYGLDSMPMDVAGWRIAYPFAVDTGISNELLYVRLDELFDVARSWVNANKYLVHQGQQMRLTKNNTIRRITLLIDHRLYDNGVYLSPDLFVPVFPVSSGVLSALAILTAGVWAFLSVVRK
ncbi:MAG: hypothetical protein ABFD25_08235 [Clostridiaceae bacterium]